MEEGKDYKYIRQVDIGDVPRLFVHVYAYLFIFCVKTGVKIF